MDLSTLTLDSGFWYLATPYSRYGRGLEIAFQHAATACAELLKSGVTAYSPICHSHPIAVHGGLDPLDHDIWMPFDAQLMQAAHGLLVVKMPGWHRSKGIGLEIQHFELARKPAHYLGWPKLRVL